MEKGAKRRKRNKILKIMLVVDLALLTLVVAAFIVKEYKTGLIMRGESRVTLNVGEQYEDPGVRSFLATSESNVDSSVPGDYEIKYTLWLKSVSRKVHVVDPNEIVMGLKGSEVQIVKQGDPYIESGAFAIDRETGPVPAGNIKVSSNVDTSKPGEYKVKYKVSYNDIEKEKVRTVRVVRKKSFESCKHVPILMYHWIYSQADIPEKLDGNWIEDKALEEHLKYLTDNGYYYPSWSEVAAWVDGKIDLPEKSVVLTFDDGKKAFYEHGIPLFEKYKVPVTSFLICWDKNDGRSKMRKYACEYIDMENHSYEMHQAGGVSGHKGIIAAMSEEEIEADLAKASEIVGNNDAFAYPYGDYTEAARKAIRDRGIKCAVTTEYGRAERGDDRTKLPRMRVLSTMSFEAWKSSTL